MFLHQNHVAGGGYGSIMVVMFLCLCLASQNLSQWECFVPARADLGVKLLTGTDAVTVCSRHSHRRWMKVRMLLVLTQNLWVLK